MKLISIPEERYEEYRLRAIFECYKWDPQFCNNSTLASHVLEITEEEDEEVAALTEKLDIETSADANIDISFSAKYMLDALKTMKDEEILILLNGEVKPIVIKSMTDESLIQLILPIKTY